MSVPVEEGNPQWKGTAHVMETVRRVRKQHGVAFALLIWLFTLIVVASTGPPGKESPSFSVEYFEDAAKQLTTVIMMHDGSEILVLHDSNGDSRFDLIKYRPDGNKLAAVLIDKNGDGQTDVWTEINSTGTYDDFEDTNFDGRLDTIRRDVSIKELD